VSKYVVEKKGIIVEILYMVAAGIETKCNAITLNQIRECFDCYKD